jgi:L-iditol 2-dehydrogenase
MTTMRAVVLDADGAPTLADVPAPQPRAGEALVVVKAVGLCGSDVEKLRSPGAVPGAVLGHEVAGEIVTGPLPAGTRVAVAHHVPCGACDRCLAGHEPLCPQFTASNLRPGGFAERLVASAPHVAATVLPLPPSVSDHAAVFVEPLACVLRGADALPAGRGAVVGCGAIGQLFVRTLAARGDAVHVLEPDARRLALALERAERPAAAGDDLDYAAVTAPAGLNAALALLRPGGTCLVFAAPSALVQVDLGRIYRQELRVVGVRSTTPAHLGRALAALDDGTVAVDDLVTDVLPLARFAEGVRRYRAGEALKVVFEP